jgi:hypothetical protein
VEIAHLALDSDTGTIMASTLTGNDVGDPSQVTPLQDRIEATIATVTADGAYDGMPTYAVVGVRVEDIRAIIPSPVIAVLREEAGHNPVQRNEHTLLIAARGRLCWQKETETISDTSPFQATLFGELDHAMSKEAPQRNPKLSLRAAVVR